MYGVGLPILFPIAAMSFLGLYLVEKTMVYYAYRQPPMYDEKLNNNVLSLLTYSPLLFLSFGYWMLSSRQLLSNDISYAALDSDVRVTDHVWTEIFTARAYSLCPHLPLIVTFWIFLFGTIFRDHIYKVLAAILPSLIKVGDLEIDEDLDNYFNTLDDHDRNWSIKEEENAITTLGLKTLNDETLVKLRNTKMGEGHIEGVHCYDILANPLYIDDFQYFSASMDDREKYIIDDDEDEDNDNAQSDLVKVILNLAFLTEKQAKAFSFSKDAYKQQRIAA